MRRPMRPANPTASSSAAAAVPTHSPDGVDLTVIRWMLSLTPLERLEALQGVLAILKRTRDEGPKPRPR